ncbi:hypothetical protein G6F35_013368 [Rhizopus arrhizus]|nr:hypothetical protein G6F35_013368 [Rhizopus arrhizus]
MPSASCNRGPAGRIKIETSSGSLEASAFRRPLTTPSSESRLASAGMARLSATLFQASHDSGACRYVNVVHADGLMVLPSASRGDPRGWRADSLAGLGGNIQFGGQRLQCLIRGQPGFLKPDGINRDPKLDRLWQIAPDLGDVLAVANARADRFGSQALQLGLAQPGAGDQQIEIGAGDGAPHQGGRLDGV